MLFSTDHVTDSKEVKQTKIELTELYTVFAVNPLSPNGDQHQFSPNDIHTLSRDKVMRIDRMVTKVELH